MRGSVCDIVEIGDGQAPDLVRWSVERFVEIWGGIGWRHTTKPRPEPAA